MKQKNKNRFATLGIIIIGIIFVVIIIATVMDVG
jgi:t-SNARE complex subunit (syntaxin)